MSALQGSGDESGLEASTLGKYRLLVGLGRGGMATVHLAVNHGPAGFNKLMVIKEVRAGLTEEAEIVGMFLDEARLAAHLQHPNVVHTYEIGEDRGRYFMVMEYLEGQPLNRLLHRLGRQLSLGTWLRIFSDLLEGLHYAHELTDYDGRPLGVVHRDVTPQNIMVTYDGVVKILDFGIAKAMSAEHHTGVGMVKGKIAYLAPEYVAGEGIDRGVDIFAVGVMLWEAVTGTRPWKGMPDLMILQKVSEGEFPSVLSVAPETPPALVAIIDKATARRRDERYATAADLQADLDAYLDTLGDRITHREIGAILSEAFEAERAHIKKVVEDKLRNLEDVSFEASHLMELAAHRMADPSTPSVSLGPVVQTHPSIPLDGPAPLEQPVTRPSLSPAWPGAAPRRPRWPWAVVAAAVVLGGVSFRGPVRATVAGVGAVTAAAATVSGEAPAVVELRLTASPSVARLFLDDAPLGESPFKGRFPRDGAVHRLRAEAPGFVTMHDTVVFDKDRLLDLRLAHQTEAEALSGSSAVALPSMPSGASPVDFTRVPSSGEKRRHLDSKNPYASDRR